MKQGALLASAPGHRRRRPGCRYRRWLVSLGALLAWASTTPARAASGESSAFTVDTRVFGKSATYVLGTGVVGIPANDGAGSLRDSVAGANPGATLTFDSSLDGMLIALGGTQITIGKNLTISAAALPTGIALSGGNVSRVLEVLAGNNVTLNHLMISDGNAGGGSGGGILHGGNVLSLINSGLSGNAAASGGAIHSSGSLVLSNVNLTGNSAVTAGGAIFNNGGFVNLTGGALSSNTAGTGGGGIYNDGLGGNVTLTNSTVTGNSAADGGGIRNESGTVSLTNATLSGNHATGHGGGLDVAGQLNIENTIVAANTGPASSNGRDIFRRGSAIVPKGANLIGNNGSVDFNSPAGPLVGTSSSPLSPLLAALGDYGGLTPTMALRSGSPATNAGIVTFKTPAIDQRGPGYLRIRGGFLDIGAYEAGNEAGYAVWALESIPPMADSSFGGDPDGDGSGNGNEYAQKLNPVVSDNELHPFPVLVDNGGNLEMRVTFPFRPEAKDLIYFVERGTVLENCSEIYRYDSSTGLETITSPPEVDATINGGAMEIEVVDTDTAGPRVYWRLRTELIVP